MTVIDADWKEPYQLALEESIRFLTNDGKFEREKWVVSQLLNALSIPFQDDELLEEAEPVDVVFRSARFQIKELMDTKRRRHDELRSKLGILENAESESDLLEQYSPKDISFSDVADLAAEKAKDLAEIKYGPTECASLDLLCYFNWLDYGVTPPMNCHSYNIDFRSLSIVTNTHCSVLFAKNSAPDYLRRNLPENRTGDL